MFARPPKIQKRIRPAFLPRPLLRGGNQIQKSFFEKLVSVLRILSPENSFAKPSPHLYSCTPLPFPRLVVAVCRAFSRTSASAEALCRTEALQCAGNASDYDFENRSGLGTIDTPNKKPDF